MAKNKFTPRQNAAINAIEHIRGMDVHPAMRGGPERLTAELKERLIDILARDAKLILRKVEHLAFESVVEAAELLAGEQP